MESLDLEKLELPGIDCGSCGHRTCENFREQLKLQPSLLKRCTLMGTHNLAGLRQSDPEAPPATISAALSPKENSNSCSSYNICRTCPSPATKSRVTPLSVKAKHPWVDSLGREFDFYLEHFPEDSGPREIIIPHNPIITREMNIQAGDTLIGRPLGMSCGCPITHCGNVVSVDSRTGVLTWCVTGPLGPREKGYKDIGYYIAEAYEGLIKDARCDIKIGMRYYFQPRMCMLQWRHSGLVNYINKTADFIQVRVEGLWIG